MRPTQQMLCLGCLTVCTILWSGASEATPVMAFSSDRDGRMDIFVMDEGGGVRNVTRISFADYDSLGDYTKRWGGGLPAWSPDGTRIAFTFYRQTYEEQEQEVYVVDAGGGYLTNLSNSPGIDWYPSWSPDGSRIAFASWRDGDSEIYVMNADGSSQQNLSLSPSWESGPAWSPDGTQIAFCSDRTGVHQIYVMAPDGFDVRTIPGHPVTCTGPAWSPDGTRLAFWTKLGFRIVERDGTEVSRLDPGVSGFGDPVWSPDGRELAFDVLEDRQTIDIYAISVETGAVRPLSDRVGRDFGVSWFPGAGLPSLVRCSSWAAIKLLAR